MKSVFLSLFVLVAFQICKGQQKIIVVAKDGSGNFSTVQEAFNSIPENNKSAVTVFIKDGVYKEKLHLNATKDFVSVIGQDEYKTILTNDDHTGKVTRKGDTINTRDSYSFIVYANNFTARNITIQNDAGFAAGQAVALESDGDKARYYNCRLVGFQDVLFTNNPDSRQFYNDCYIEGTTDFIFGSATAWFEHCHIHSKKNSHVTAASTPQNHSFGYVFNDCVLTGDTTLHNVSLGRPWRPFASVTYIHCYIGADVKPEGFSNWNKTDNYKTARYAEYDNYGPGADKSGRVVWEKQLNDKEVKKYTVENVLGGWLPGQFE